MFFFRCCSCGFMIDKQKQHKWYINNNHNLEYGLVFRQSRTNEWHHHHNFRTQNHSLLNYKLHKLGVKCFKLKPKSNGINCLVDFFKCVRLLHHITIKMSHYLLDFIAFGIFSFNSFLRHFWFLPFRLNYKLPTALNNYRNELDVTHSNRKIRAFLKYAAFHWNSSQFQSQCNHVNSFSPVQVFLFLRHHLSLASQRFECNVYNFRFLFKWI